MCWLSIILRIMKLPDILPHLLFPWFFANNRRKVCFHWKKQCSTCYGDAVKQDLFFITQIHIMALLVSIPWPLLRHPGAVSSPPTSPAPLPMAKADSRGRHPVEVQLRVVPVPSYTLLPFWQQIITPTQLHVTQFNVAVIRGWGHWELMVVSRRRMFALWTESGSCTPSPVLDSLPIFQVLPSQWITWLSKGYKPAEYFQ